jgi:KipI family sensor histidine kinase inhibitor
VLGDLVTPTVEWLGDRAVLVCVADPQEREGLHRMLAEALPALLIRRGLRELLVESETPSPALRSDVERVLEADLVPQDVASPTSRVVHLSVHYDGTDLPLVADLLRCSTQDVVRAHGEQAWRVAMMGFAPGFGYLEPVGASTLDWGSLPRRESPRPRVPRGSVAIAAGMSAVYPQEMPGGWHLIGVTAVTMFDVLDEDRPAVLSPGDVVRFGPAQEPS